VDATPECFEPQGGTLGWRRRLDRGCAETQQSASREPCRSPGAPRAAPGGVEGEVT
jgi:hypothetical protein